jgi:hypothetical protein
MQQLSVFTPFGCGAEAATVNETPKQYEASEAEADAGADMKEVDILRNKMSDDLLKDEIYLPLREEMKAAKYKVIGATPPCNTHTRAAFANAGEPAPGGKKRNRGEKGGVRRPPKQKVETPIDMKRSICFWCQQRRWSPRCRCGHKTCLRCVPRPIHARLCVIGQAALDGRAVGPLPNT